MGIVFVLFLLSFSLLTISFFLKKGSFVILIFATLFFFSSILASFFYRVSLFLSLLLCLLFAVVFLLYFRNKEKRNEL